MKPSFISKLSNKNITRNKLFNNPLNRKLNFLVVDDGEINRIIITSLLSDLKYNVEEAVNGKEVIEKIEKGKKYDIIWMDISMPFLNGMDCTKILREKYNYKMPIIGVTCFADKSLLDECINSGMEDVIMKPINKLTIVDIANKFCCQQKTVAPRKLSLS